MFMQTSSVNHVRLKKHADRSSSHSMYVCITKQYITKLTTQKKKKTSVNSNHICILLISSKFSNK
jgi:hypothetical protein